MERDEGAREALATQLTQLALGRVEGMRIHPAFAQRRQHPRAGHERHLALSRCATHQNRYPAKCPRFVLMCGFSHDSPPLRPRSRVRECRLPPDQSILHPW